MTIETITETGALAAPASGLPITVASSMNNADVHLWLERFELFHQIAQGLVTSDFIPKSMKPTMPPNATPASHPAEFAKIEANATAAMMAGSGYGFGPLAAMQNMHVINGAVGMSASIKHGLAQAAGHRMWESERSYEAVTWCGRRKDWGDDIPDVVIRITREEAIKAGWGDKKDTYDKVPADMLAARCKGRVADRIIPELLHGIVTLEDARDLPPETPAPVVTRVTAKDIQARTAAADTQPGTPGLTATSSEAAGEDARAPADVTGTVELISLPQSRRLYALLRELGAGEKAAGLAVVSTLAERPVESTKTLTAEEAGPLLDKLADLAKRPEAERRAAVEFMVNPPPPPADLPIDGAAAGAEADRG